MNSIRECDCFRMCEKTDKTRFWAFFFFFSSPNNRNQDNHIITMAENSSAEFEAFIAKQLQTIAVEDEV